MSRCPYVTNVNEHDNHYELTILPRVNLSAIQKNDPNVELRTLTVKVRKQDLERLGWKIEGDEFLRFLNQRLLKVVGIDFDQTISNTHTFHNGVNKDKKNLKCGDALRQSLQQIDKTLGFHSIVISNNYKAGVLMHIKEWKIDKHFKLIVGDRDYFLTPRNKEFGFMIFNELTVEQGTCIDAEGFIDFNNAQAPIATVDAVMIDDDSRRDFISRMSGFGIHYIQVDKEENHSEHLTALDIFLSFHAKQDDSEKLESADVRNSKLCFPGIDDANRWPENTLKSKYDKKNPYSTELLSGDDRESDDSYNSLHSSYDITPPEVTAEFMRRMRSASPGSKTPPDDVTTELVGSSGLWARSGSSSSSGASTPRDDEVVDVSEQFFRATLKRKLQDYLDKKNAQPTAKKNSL